MRTAVAGILLALPCLIAQVVGLPVRVHVVDDVTGAPVQNARIAVRGTALAEPLVARTGDQGDSEWRMPNGTYELSVEKGNFFPESLRRFAVAGGQQAALEIRLVPMREISGRLLYEDGSPLARALILPRPPAGEVPLGGGASAETLEDGSFTLTRLRPGRYSLLFVPAPPRVGVDSRLPMEAKYPPEGARRNQLIDVRVSSEASIGTVYLAKQAGISIEGAIDSSPLYGAAAPVQVHLIREDSRITVARGRTKNGGSFTLPNIPSGGYLLFAEIAEIGSGKPSCFFGLQRIEVGATDVRGIRLRVPDTVPTFEGVVELDQGDEPALKVPGVAIVHEPSILPVTSIPPARSRADGTFVQSVMSLASPGDGLHNLRIELIPEGTYVASVTQNDEPMPVPLTTKANAGPIRILLRDDGGTILGRLEGAPGLQQGGIEPLVVLAPRDAPRPQYSFRVSGVDLRGEFEFMGIAPGAYDVVWFDDEDEYTGPDSLSKGRAVVSGLKVEASSLMEMTVPRP